MLISLKGISELTPGSVDGFTVESINWRTLRIQPMENQTIYSLAEKMINCFKKNPELMNIEFDYEGVNFTINNRMSDPQEISQYCMDEVASIRKQNPQYPFVFPIERK